MNGKRAGVIVPLGAALAASLLFAGCKHDNVEYSELMSRLNRGVEGEGVSTVTTNVVVGTNVVALPRLQTVVLSNKLDTAWLKPSTNLFTLGPGDRVEIEVIGEPASRTTTIVAPDGKIYFNLLQGVDVWGATLSQAATMLENELAKFVKEKPQISVTLRQVESKRIWVLGRVHAPGVYSMAGPMTVLEAVSMAGGTMTLANYQDQEAAGISEELADLRRSFVLRKGHLLPVNFDRLLRQGDMSQNIFLEPDDFVYFPAATAREVIVLGAVALPRRVPYVDNMTVAAAVAAAYGTIKGAYMHHVAVVRGGLDNPQIAIVDYKGVLRGVAKDMALQPQDIVYVPFSPYRYLEKYAEVVINTFVSSAAINAGSAAVNKQPTGGAGIFIPVGSGVQIIPPVNPPPPH
jgi:protein involved in polysaccharide export with SLBB domain